MRFSLFVLSVFFFRSDLVGQISQREDGAQHGTCAIALASQENIALIVDSRLTPVNAIKPCVEAHHEGCKAVLVRKDLLVAVTGAFSDRIHGSDWKVSDEMRKLLSGLPAVLQKTDLDAFGNKWFYTFVHHYRSNPELVIIPSREISTLLLATRIEGVPYIYKAEISANDKGLLSLNGSELSLSSLPTLMYAGSCRDHVTTHPFGLTALPSDPPEVAESFELRELGDRKKGARSVDQFVEVLQGFEDLFTKIENREGHCWIGSPYDVATWAAGDEGWKTNFKVNCNDNKRHVSMPADKRKPKTK